MDPDTTLKFFGCDPREGSDAVAQQHLKKNTANFFTTPDDEEPVRAPEAQTADSATAIFYGVETKQRGHDLGRPIPGYSGFNGRIEADNIFGQTYNNARNNAEESDTRINAERGETLKQTQQFLPSYAQARAGRQQ